ncbi:MAG: ABC transporter ATP-binding protein [Roseiflexus sp.]|nr:ABC transporter ATP-binding protein [Roseiflexus sp.]MBO9333280.1 ABC transporter ATP-binding protein [Roseiflexus sp.]MBO9342568.1 ABC transporter ATP-binding protein [Roseiflexus sp.]MBO9363855.1 ABC transporter ATP-binding protein [Roseiflexus sp.]MBO9381237.1 ABC transporter ATP-binding protein [Roseiflexus sp.]
MSAVIEFDNVSKRFLLQHERHTTLRERLFGVFRPRTLRDEFWALRDVSFTVERGESFGLIGHNGAGKSTALKLMTRILEPTLGRVRLRGRVAALLELGSGFHPELSGRDNVFLYGSLMGLSRREMAARLDAIVAFAEMEDFLDLPVKHYSSGMYTRLAFAVATAVDPDILITDEVLAVGDEAFQRKCMDRILRFRHAGKTIIFVSHALDTVRTLCDRAVWLDRGVVRAIGATGEVIDAYLADVNRREYESLAQMDALSIDPTRRFGSREVEIIGVELLNAEGVACPIALTGAPVTFRVRYRAHQTVPRPVFGLAIHHESGTLLAGPNTLFAGLDIPAVRGEGVVDMRVAALPLLAGRYLLSAAVYDETMLHPYDHHDRLYHFVVHNRDGSERFGALILGGQWSWHEE